jgi:hypothetical protein
MLDYYPFSSLYLGFRVEGSSLYSSGTEHKMKCMCLLQAGGSGVLVSPLTYIFDEETPRYRQMLDALKA